MFNRVVQRDMLARVRLQLNRKIRTRRVPTHLSFTGAMLVRTLVTWWWTWDVWWNRLLLHLLRYDSTLSHICPCFIHTCFWKVIEQLYVDIWDRHIFCVKCQLCNISFVINMDQFTQIDPVFLWYRIVHQGWGQFKKNSNWSIPNPFWNWSGKWNCKIWIELELNFFFIVIEWKGIEHLIFLWCCGWYFSHWLEYCCAGNGI